MRGDAVPLDGIVFPKIEHPEELTGPGRLHESAGEAMLLRAGVDPALARFCRTLGTLLSSGVAILESLDITARTSVYHVPTTIPGTRTY